VEKWKRKRGVVFSLEIALPAYAFPVFAEILLSCLAKKLERRLGVERRSTLFGLL